MTKSLDNNRAPAETGWIKKEAFHPQDAIRGASLPQARLKGLKLLSGFHRLSPAGSTFFRGGTFAPGSSLSALRRTRGDTFCPGRLCSRFSGYSFLYGCRPAPVS